ncbi:MAG: S41 family peptidase [Bauldia sp.]
MRLGRLIRRLGAFAALSAAMPAGAQTAADDADWAKTTLDERALEMFDRAYPCLKSELTALFCLRQVDAIGNLLRPAERLVPKDIGRLRPERVVTVLKDFGALQLVRVNADQPAPARLGWDEARARREAEQRMYFDAAKSLVTPGQQGGGPIPDFLAIRADLLSRLPQGVSKQRAIATGLNAAVLVFDAHAHVDPKEAWDVRQRGGGNTEFVGIGASIGANDDTRFIVQSTVEGGSARRAGVIVGDVIDSVDGKQVAGLKIDDVVGLIRGGPKGSIVRLDVERRGKAMAIEVMRDDVRLLNVAGGVVDDLGARFGYLKLASFLPAKTCDDAKAVLQDLRADSTLRGIILDLRGNLGGDLNQGLCVAGLLFGHKEVVKLVSSRFEQHLFTTAEQATDLPIAVLINESSASASEFVAGAVQDYERGWLVGTTTVGKGSAQTSDFLDRTDKTVYYFGTEARFYLPSGRTNQRVGVIPDFTVYSGPNPTEEELNPLREEDLIFSVLPAEGTGWVQPRSAAVARVQACVDSGKRASAEFAQVKDRQTPPDYQLYNAEEILLCDAGPSPAR